MNAEHYEQLAQIAAWSRLDDDLKAHEEECPGCLICHPCSQAPPPDVSSDAADNSEGS